MMASSSEIAESQRVEDAGRRMDEDLAVAGQRLAAFAEEKSLRGQIGDIGARHARRSGRGRQRRGHAGRFGPHALNRQIHEPG